MLEAVWLMVRIVAVGAIVAHLIAMLKANRPEPPCHSCKHLAQRGGRGSWKYYCNCKSVVYKGFDKPPEYCSYYEKREATEPPKPIEEKVKCRGVLCEDCRFYRAYEDGYCVLQNRYVQCDDGCVYARKWR